MKRTIISGMTGKQLQRLRRAAGMSREALATHAGYSAFTIGRKERGVTEITVPEADFFKRILVRAS